MSKYLSLLIFVVVVMSAGIAIGFSTPPGEWYASLQKPWFNPPNWVFGPVWTILYALIAVAGWLTWQRDSDSAAMKLWFAQMLLNFAWTPVFFGAHLPGPALAIILAMLCAILAFIALSWQRVRTASWLFVPYAAWVSFATLLNGSIWLLN
jgi:translocator protein